MKWIELYPNRVHFWAFVIWSLMFRFHNRKFLDQLSNYKLCTHKTLSHIVRKYSRFLQTVYMYTLNKL